METVLFINKRFNKKVVNKKKGLLILVPFLQDNLGNLETPYLDV